MAIVVISKWLYLSDLRPRRKPSVREDVGLQLFRDKSSGIRAMHNNGIKGNTEGRISKLQDRVA